MLFAFFLGGGKEKFYIEHKILHRRYLMGNWCMAEDDFEDEEWGDEDVEEEEW
ncbi:hypothetical protein [[Eubacterium] cellulosolvens]